MADTTCMDYDMSDPENDETTQDTQDVCKNLLEDFSVPAAKLMRESVAHSREHMQVYLRIRPFTNREKEQGESQDCMEVSQPSSLLMRAPKDSFTFKSSQRGFSTMTHKFTFSRIFGEDTAQKEFFDETMLGTVKDFIDGQNCLLFTYGVTNAGKTYTIQGVPQDGGILPRSLDVIFNSLEGRLFPSMQLKPRFFCDVVKLDERQRKKEAYIKDSVLSLAEGISTKQDGTRDSSGMDDADDSRASNYTTATEDSQSEISVSSITDDASVPSVLEDVNNRIPDDTSIDVEAQGPLKFSVWVSFAEIYNEYIYDLLEAIPKAKKVRRQPLKLSEDKNGQIYIKGLKEICVQSADEAYKILKIGQQNLSIAATKLNQCSSRSHCIFSIKILRVVDVENPHVARVSQLSFCDLAGSERYTRTQNTGDRLKEAGNINTSLLTLGKCIHTLRYNQNHPKSQPKIIPFRESKLTRLFQSFFLGKGKASMVVNVNQCASGFDETIQVLKFSAIAKQVTTVTSKLDNKWKVPAAAGPKLVPSRALSLALRQSLSSGRVSVPWATPGPPPDPNLDLTTVEESFIEEEDEDEEEDVERTPKESILKGQSRAELIGLVEALKTQLIEEKKRTMMLEVQIREEVCQEMAQQLVQIEGEYKDQLEKERLNTEEMFEKRLEMYEQFVMDSRKKPQPDNNKEEEYVSSLLLHAEQVKVQDKEKIIEGLRQDIAMLKEAFEDSQDKMHSQDAMLAELQALTEAEKLALEEAKAKLCTKDEKILEMEAALQKLQDAAAAREEEQSKRVTSLEQKITAAKQALQEAENNSKVYQEKLSVVQQKHANQVAQLHSEFKILQESLESHQATSNVDKDLSGKLAAAISEAAELRCQLQSSAEEHSSVVTALDVKMEELQNKLNETEVVIQDYQTSLKEAKAQVERTEEKLQMTEVGKSELQDELQSRIDALQNDCREQESRATGLAKKLGDSETETKRVMEKLNSSEVAHLEVVTRLEDQIEQLKQELVLNAKEDEIELGQAKKENNEMQKKITALKENYEKEAAALEDSHGKEKETLTAKLSCLEESRSQSERELEKLLNEARQEAEETKSKLNDLQIKYDSEVGSLQAEVKASSKTLARVDIKIEKEKQKSFDAEEKALRMEEEITSLREKNKEMEDVLADMQACFDQTNTKGQEAAVRVATLENNLEYLKEEMSVEQKAHVETKKVASEYGCQVSLLRSQLETAERTASANSNLAKRIKDLEASLQEMQQALSDKEIALAEASKWQGSASDLRSQLKVLDDKLKETQEKRSTADKMVQELSNRCTGLQQSLAQKERELADRVSSEQKSKTKADESESEIQQLKDVQAQSERKIQAVEKDLEEQKAKTKSKAETIKSLMSKVEMQCLKEKSLERDLASNKEVIEGLKAALQEQETTMASQDEILASKEEELQSVTQEREDLQTKYTDLLKSSNESRQEVRMANKNHERWITEKENLKKEQIELQLELSKTEQEREELKMKLSESESDLKDSKQAMRDLEQDFGNLRQQMQAAPSHPEDCPDKLQAQKLQKKVTALEQEIMKQVASKEETLTKWREERDRLVKALEQKMNSLLEAQKTNEAALAKKQEHIELLKAKMMATSESQAITDDESDVEEQERTKTRGQPVSGDLQMEVQQLRQQLHKEKTDREKVVADYEESLEVKRHAIKELEGANRHLQQQLGLIEVSVDVKPLSPSHSESSTARLSARSPSPQPDPDSPDLFTVDVKDQESFHQPGRRRTRVEMDVTPLQKKQPTRKTRANTRKAKKRKSTELLEEIDIEAFQKRSRAEEQSTARATRSTRRRMTRANKEKEVHDNNENTLDNKLAEMPSTNSRGKRAALSKIGDLLQNTPLAKSAKKFVESAATHMTSPAKSPEVEVVACYPPPTTEKKRKRRLLKTDISAPFASSPFEVVNVGESKSDNSHSIVTRKLRSRNTRV
ncbi:kinesin-like protein KIF20B isoform X2 [Acanthaster planci]|uniref:Kinesin-like protein KIF20B isoform X2 n=1 Tax=Acanthaster planci TaxID=133434 RepID=A0A8B7YJE8_ACAPL|nr:kinesin-like protein KIF20B isoform X2 [Acanthaster planci]